MTRPSDDRVQLACCVLRALMESGRPDEGSDNDVYWHTREACAEVARARGVRWPEVLDLVQRGEWQDAAIRDPDLVRRESEPLWTEVMHPDLLIQEIHEI